MEYTFSQWYQDAYKSFIHVGNQQRLGQFFFNYLLNTYPEIAEMVRGIEIDPFHNNDKFPAFLNFVCKEMES